MMNRIKAPVLAVGMAFVASGCNLLDVDNPNSLTEESVQLEAAANGMANGSLRLLADAVSTVWQEIGVTSDNMYWTGSRDGWNLLDQGLVNDPLNEFIDGAFPTLGRAVWMGQEAVDVLSEHVANNPNDEDFAVDLARAHMYNGAILMVTGEYMEDMTFSDKMEDGPPVGPSNMSGVLDDAIAELTLAVDQFTALGESDLVIDARAIRARAYMSRAIWDQLNPGATVGGAIAYPSAVADAAAVLAAESNYRYAFNYSASSGGCDLCGWINNRGENQIETTLVAAVGSGTGYDGRGATVLVDPVAGTADPTITTLVARLSDDQYGSLTLADARLMRLILAEHELATGGADFGTHIDALRALDGEVAWTGSSVSALAILQHERRANTLVMGLRLQDMYRWGITDPRWQPNNTTLTSPGTMFPIAIVEIRANCHLNGQGCGG